MPSFDVVSQIDLHEVANAADQTSREVATRFDFKGTKAGIESKDAVITLYGDNEFQINQVRDILDKKIVKRGIDVRALIAGKLEESLGGAHLPITLQQGIDQTTAKKLIKAIKNAKLKVQTSIQGDQLRVSGKKRDDLQSAIATLEDSNAEVPLQFINFRD